MPTSTTYVENVRKPEVRKVQPVQPVQRQRVQNAVRRVEPLPVPVHHFRRVNGQDVIDDGRGADGRTSGSPPIPPFVNRVPMGDITGRKNNGSGDTLDSGGDNGATPGDPRVMLGTLDNPGNATRSRTVVCPDCGFTFNPVPVKPLLLPAMPSINHKKPYVIDDDDDKDDDDDETPVTNCPRCGASV